MICSVDGCGRERYARGWCHAHYQRWRRLGDVLPSKAVGYRQGSDRKGIHSHDGRCLVCTEVPALYPDDPTEVARRIGRNPEAMHRHIRRWLPEYADWSRPASNAARLARAS